MIFAVGDIHGQLNMLEPALTRLTERLRPNDAVIFLGDYIDRGPDSEGVLRRLMRFKKQHPGTMFLRGNHEDLLLRSCDGDKRREELWLLNGGMATLASFGLGGNSNWRKKFPRWALDFLGATHAAVKFTHFHFVHAGVVPYGVDTEVEPDLDARLWIRQPFIRHGDSPGRIVVFGHTPQPDHLPLIHMNKVGLDTGAGQRGGRLSVAGFDDELPRPRSPEFTLFQVCDDGTVTPDEYVRNVLRHLPQNEPTFRFSIPSISSAPIIPTE
ncbi:MAG: metallophosphoesterase family protein [Capsulimonas sp.]|uniref:metallophosphoesterase family protein n=1 Tax=Capsulimonas sp. TaxID=2494211 RepID=UPI003263C220